VQHITALPSQPDPITGSFTTWEDKEVNLSNFEIQFWDSQSEAWSSTERPVSFYFNSLNRIDPNNLICYKTECPYFITSWAGVVSNFASENIFNVFDPVSQTFKYYKSIDSDSTYRNTISISRTSPFSNLATDYAKVLEIAKIHKISYRSRVIINGVPSDWAINDTDVIILSYEVIWKQLAYLGRL